jgi:hypothetical protein
MAIPGMGAFPAGAPKLEHKATLWDQAAGAWNAAGAGISTLVNGEEQNTYCQGEKQVGRSATSVATSMAHAYNARVSTPTQEEFKAWGDEMQKFSAAHPDSFKGMGMLGLYGAAAAKPVQAKEESVYDPTGQHGGIGPNDPRFSDRSHSVNAPPTQQHS